MRFETILELIGRGHPMLLHIPIGMLMGLLACEAVALVRRKPMDKGVRITLALFAALAAALTVASGLLLSREDAYGGDRVDLHKWLGIGVGAGAVLCLITAAAGWNRFYGLFLVLTCGVLVPAGHIGSGITRDPDFLFEPLHPKVRGPESRNGQGPKVNPVATTRFGREVLPIFEERCNNCHSESRRKGGLDMHSLEALKDGSDNGSVLEGLEDADCELLYRITLPIADDDHMPPASKKQLSAEEIEIIKRWISDGMPED